MQSSDNEVQLWDHASSLCRPVEHLKLWPSQCLLHKHQVVSCCIKSLSNMNSKNICCIKSLSCAKSKCRNKFVASNPSQMWTQKTKGKTRKMQQPTTWLCGALLSFFHASWTWQAHSTGASKSFEIKLRLLPEWFCWKESTREERLSDDVDADEEKQCFQWLPANSYKYFPSRDLSQNLHKL